MSTTERSILQLAPMRKISGEHFEEIEIVATGEEIEEEKSTDPGTKIGDITKKKGLGEGEELYWMTKFDEEITLESAYKDINNTDNFYVIDGYKFTPNKIKEILDLYPTLGKEKAFTALCNVVDNLIEK